MVKSGLISSSKETCKICKREAKLTKHHIIDTRASIRLANYICEKNPAFNANFISFHKRLKEVAGTIQICRECHDGINELYKHMNGILGEHTVEKPIKERPPPSPEKRKRLIARAKRKYTKYFVDDRGIIHWD